MTVHPDTETGSARCDLDWLATTKQAAATRNQTAQLFNVDPRTVDRGIERGDLPSVRVGGKVLIPVTALRQLLGVE